MLLIWAPCTLKASLLLLLSNTFLLYTLDTTLMLLDTFTFTWMLYRAPWILKASLLLLLPNYSFLQLRYLNTSMLLDTFLFIYLDASDLGTLYTKSISAPPDL